MLLQQLLDSLLLLSKLLLLEGSMGGQSAGGKEKEREAGLRITNTDAIGAMTGTLERCFVL